MDFSSFTEGIFNIYGSEVITLGTLIRNLREEQNISQKTLCQGICSISKLSKIEKNMLNPDIIQAETLLQRLGLSEREFIFWGDKRESQLHELQLQLRRRAYSPKTGHEEILEEYQNLIRKKEVLYEQLYCYEHSYFIQDSNERIQYLTDAINLTLKDFNIYTITAYRLSWIELTILNTIASEYLYTDKPYMAVQYLQQILIYHGYAKVDQILQAQTLLVTYKILFTYFYTQGRHTEAVAFFAEKDFTIMKYFISKYSLLLFYYCQSLGECGKTNDAVLPACYSCGIENLFESFENSVTLKNGLIQDFDLDIRY